MKPIELQSWLPSWPTWAEMVTYVSTEEARYAKRGGKVYRVVMSQTTWMHLCDKREEQGLRKIRRGLDRPGQKHYDRRTVMGHRLHLDGDCPPKTIWVQGT